MWALDNRTPFAADGNWVRDMDGWHHWVVALRGTYRLPSDGVLELVSEQSSPLLAPEYLGEYGASSLRCEADITFLKPETDVIVNACAHAPGGWPCDEVPVTLRVASVDKTLLVRGEAIYESSPVGPIASSPKPFLTMPIRYERAYGGGALDPDDPQGGGFDARNPVGVGHATRRRDLVGTPAPNVVYPSAAAGAGCAGFGPVASFWSPRDRLSGSYDERWRQTRSPLLPDDWDVRSLLCAPADQRIGRYLSGGERVELLNMTAERSLVVELPVVELEFSTWIGRRCVPHEGRLVTVLIEPESSLLSLVWQTMLRVPAPDSDYLDATVVTMRRGPL